MPSAANDIEYTERGQGPTILFVPGSFGTGAGWRPIIELLGGGFRTITTSLLGYGATGERRTAATTSIDLEADVLETVVCRAAAPVHIVAHSFGGIVTLALCLRGTCDIRSLTLIEANPLDVLRQAGDATHYRQFRSMSDAYLRDFEAGDREAARRVIDFYGGPGTFDAFPHKVRDYVVATTPVNILDWSSGYGFEAPLSAYAAIQAPALIVRGEAGHPAMLSMATILHGAVQNSTLVSIADGSHFLPSTHAPRLAELIRAHVTASAA